MLHPNPNLHAVLHALANPTLPTIAMGLERVAELLDALGNPQRRLPPVVHIAGTNGKGSVLAYLRAAFEAAGLRVHAYTSPHLVRFNERIRLAGREIDDGALELLLRRVQAAADRVPVTFFEATTAAAFLAFAEHPADVVLLETGMGGRLDATNLVPTPALTLITPISMDHTEFLGDTLAAIAHEKAGILKANVPCVVGLQKPAAMDVIQRRAAELSSPLHSAAQEYCWQQNSAAQEYCWQQTRADAWEYVATDGTVWTLPTPALAGPHQIENAALAVHAMRQFAPQFGLTQAHAAAAMQQVQWPARLQPLPAHPLLAALPAGSALWLDGGHNPSAGHAIAAWAKAQHDPRPLWLVCGMLANKDAAGYLAPFASLLAGVVTVPIATEAGMHAHTPPHLAEIAHACGIKHAHPATSLRDAMTHVAPHTPARVLIGGSLYLAGEVLAMGEAATA